MTATTFHIPTLETGRLTLRSPTDADFDAYAAFLASDRTDLVGGPYSRRDALAKFVSLKAHWVQHGFGRWLVADAETDAPLGVVGLYFPDGWPEPEIAWSLFAAGEGRGVAAEAALATRAFAYDTLGWSTVASLIDGRNTRSLALANRLGCTHDGDHLHPEFGLLQIWRHPAPEARA